MLFTYKRVECGKIVLCSLKHLSFDEKTWIAMIDFLSCLVIYYQLFLSRFLLKSDFVLAYWRWNRRFNHCRIGNAAYPLQVIIGGAIIGYLINYPRTRKFVLFLFFITSLDAVIATPVAFWSFFSEESKVDENCLNK